MVVKLLRKASIGMKNQQETLEAAQAFIEAINSHDLEWILRLMSPGIRFIDSHGNILSGATVMRAAWQHYFAMFPDYRIDVGSTLCAENRVVLIGEASACYLGDQERSWRIPVAVLANVHDRSVTEWQVFADTSIPFASTL